MRVQDDRTGEVDGQIRERFGNRRGSWPAAKRRPDALPSFQDVPTTASATQKVLGSSRASAQELGSVVAQSADRGPARRFVDSCPSPLLRAYSQFKQLSSQAHSGLSVLERHRSLGPGCHLLSHSPVCCDLGGYRARAIVHHLPLSCPYSFPRVRDSSFFVSLPPTVPSLTSQRCLRSTNLHRRPPCATRAS